MRSFNDVDFHAFIDGQCSPERQAAIAAHLATSPADAARVEVWRRQKQTIRDLYAAAAAEPVPLWLTVAQIAPVRPLHPSARTPVALKSGGKADRHTTASRPILFLALLAAFAAGCGATSGFARREIAGKAVAASAVQATRFTTRAREAQETFGLDADRPVDVADVPPGRLRTWFGDRLPFKVRIPDLRTSGWTLLGGRLTPDDPGPAALLVYVNAGGDRLSLFAGRTSTAPPSDKGFVTVWTNGEVGYAWMSTGHEQWLGENGDMLQRAVERSSTD